MNIMKSMEEVRVLFSHKNISEISHVLQSMRLIYFVGFSDEFAVFLSSYQYLVL